MKMEKPQLKWVCHFFFLLKNSILKGFDFVRAKKKKSNAIANCDAINEPMQNRSWKKTNPLENESNCLLQCISKVVRVMLKLRHILRCIIICVLYKIFMRPEYVYCGEICSLTASQNDENGKVETIFKVCKC